MAKTAYGESTPKKMCALIQSYGMYCTMTGLQFMLLHSIQVAHEHEPLSAKEDL
jgi:hypothetical protein